MHNTVRIVSHRSATLCYLMSLVLLFVTSGVHTAARFEVNQMCSGWPFNLAWEF